MALVVATVLAAFSAAPATARDYWTMAPFLPEQGSRAPKWVQYSLAWALRDRLLREPGSDMTGWHMVSSFYTQDGLAVPDQTWSDEELARVARRCQLRAIVVGRYALEGGAIRVRIRVWSESGAQDVTARVRLSTAHYDICDVAERVARASGIIADLTRPRGLERPWLASGLSFRMLGEITEADSRLGNAAGVRAAKRWAREDSRSTLALFRQALVTFERVPRERAAQLARLVAKRPSDREFAGELGWAREEAGDFDGARDAYEKALTLDIGDPLVCLDLARVCRRLGDDVEAAKTSRMADSLALAWPDHLSIGRYHYDDGNYADAVRHLSAALRLGAPRCYTLNNLGLALARQQKWKEALDAWDLSLLTNPRNAGTLYQVGCARSELGEWQAAEKSFRSTLRLDPKRVSARYGLSYSLLRERRLDEAEREARAVLKADPKHRNAHWLLGSIERRRGNPFGAIYHWVQWRPPSRRFIGWTVAVLSLLFIAGLALVVVVTKRRLAPDGPPADRKDAADRPAAEQHARRTGL